MKLLKSSSALILITLALLLSAESRAEPQHPKHSAVKNAEHHGAPKNSQQASAPDQRGTDKLPLSIKLLNTGKSEAETAQEARQVEEQNNTDWWIVRLTIAAVGVGLLQLAAFIVQAFVLARTISAMRESSQRELRAYVSGLPDFIFSFDDKNYPRVKFTIRNSGKTPAYQLVHRTEIVGCPNPLQPGYVFPSFSDDSRSAPAVLSPNVPLNGTKIAARLFTASEITEIRNGTLRVYVFGRIEYRDAFRENRWTTFCFGLTADDATLRKLTSNYGPKDLEVAFEVAPVGNDAT